MRLKKVAAAAVAMVMAVSMLSVPVFADETTPTEEQQGAAVDTTTTSDYKADKNSETGTATTKVNLIYSKMADQLSVTVPISVTFAVKSTGEFVTPSAGAYYIKNSSIVPIHVAEIKAEMTNDNSSYSFSDSEITEGETQSKVYLKLEQKKKDDSSSNATNYAVLNNSNVQLQGNWDIAAKNGDDGTKMELHFVGAVSKAGLKSTWADSSDQICTITYTIGAGKAKTTNSSSTDE